MTKLLKEPLVHFLLLGGGFFALFAVVSDDYSSGTGTVEEIVVTEGRIDSLLIQFGKVWQRPPTEAELDGLIADHVREEILYREAVAMGLDRDDTIVRRRMRQKIEFLSEDIAAMAEPTEEELEQFLATHPDSFRQESRFSFRQVFISVDDREKSAEADAVAVLAKLQENDEDAFELSDSMLLDHQFEQQSERDVARVFGNGFVDALLETPVGSWQGPVISGFGLHLIFIGERIEGKLPELAEVRDAVVLEWSSAIRKRTNEEFYNALRERYTITVMKPDTENGTKVGGAE